MLYSELAAIALHSSAIITTNNITTINKHYYVKVTATDKAHAYLNHYFLPPSPEIY